MVFTGALIAILMVQIWLLLLASNWRIQRKCESLQANITPIKEGVAEDIDGKRQQISAVTKQFAGRGRILQALQEIHAYSPSAISLSRVAFESTRAGESMLTITGQADTLETALEYPTHMQEADLLKNLKTDRVVELMRPGGNSIAEFQLHCGIRE